MGAAQGQYRGPQQDDERQYAEVDADQTATSVQARRTIAARAYRQHLAEVGVHEVWNDGRLVGYRAANPDRDGYVAHFTHPRLAAERAAALGY